MVDLLEAQRLAELHRDLRERRACSRACSEPWIATGTTGTPDSSASRPRPGFGWPSSFVRERPPSRVHQHRAAAVEDRVRGDEGLLVALTAAHRERPAVVDDEVEHRGLEELRLGHELHLAPQQHRHEEVVEEAEVVGRQQHRAALGDVRRRRSRESGRGRGSAGSARSAPGDRPSPGAACARARGTCRSTPPGGGRCRPGASRMGVATPAPGRGYSPSAVSGPAPRPLEGPPPVAPAAVSRSSSPMRGS